MGAELHEQLRAELLTLTKTSPPFSFFAMMKQQLKKLQKDRRDQHWVGEQDSTLQCPGFGPPNFRQHFIHLKKNSD